MDPLFSLLLADPEEEQQKLIEDVLRDEFKITDIITSSSSADTMNLLNTEDEVHCIIVSSALDDGNGFSLVKDIRAIEKYANTPVLVISGIKERDHLLEAAASGASDFIVKPFNTRSLTLKLKKLLANKQFIQPSPTSTLETFDVTVSFEQATYACKLVDISIDDCSIKADPFHKGGAIFDRATISIDNNGTPLVIVSELIKAERDTKSTDSKQKQQIASFQFIDSDDEVSLAISEFINNIGN